MLSEKPIKPAATRRVVSVVSVPKKDGSLWFCGDYRRLSAVTIRDAYFLSLMNQCIDRLGQVTVFSTLDDN